MNTFNCPTCKGEMKIVNNMYKCEQNHSYDIAKSGYVNLLLSNNMRSKMPGDNKLMVNARKNFLNKNYYKVLSDALNELLLEHVKKIDNNSPIIFDAGCGEGYYTSNLYDYLLQSDVSAKILGADISKLALEVAAKRNKNVSFAVASIFNLPLENHFCDMLLNLFAPYCEEEFNRVLKNGGLMFVVIPGENHLWELKELIYDNPYTNETEDYYKKGFELIDTVKVEDTINLTSQEDIDNVFKMTPYYYKTSAENAKRIVDIETLETKIEFEILVYKKQ